MAVLGDLLAAARNQAGGFEAWLEARDAGMAASVAAAAARERLGAATFARAAVADFSRFASEEDWATLVSALRDSDDPGLHCLLAMVHWRLTAPGCAAHGHDRDEERNGR